MPRHLLARFATRLVPFPALQSVAGAFRNSTNPDVREIFVRSYRLVYSLSGESVYILGLIHGARQLGAIWEREKRSEH